MKQSPIFSKTYDFLSWMIPLTIKFPRSHRFVLAQTLQQDALTFQSLLIEAAHQKNPLPRLEAADAELDKLRTHIRLSRDLQLISIGQYEHAAGMLVEMGRLLGGWKKSVASG